MPFPNDETSRRFIERHFRRKNLIWSEDFFIGVLETSGKRYDIYWAVLALRDCGTARSISPLKAKILYPMQDVKATAILTIAHIAGARETEFYAETLLNKQYPEKAYAMWAINDAADQRAIDSVLEYFRTNRSKLKNGKLTNGTVVDGIEFLGRYVSQDKRILEFFTEVELSWDKLAIGERKEISKRVPYFDNRHAVD